MITSVFSKTRPFNYLFIGILSILFFVIKTISSAFTDASWLFYVEEFGFLLLILATAYLTNFIALKNGLTKNIVDTVSTLSLLPEKECAPSNSTLRIIWF